MEEFMTIYSVYARADENIKVIKVFSTCFEQPLETDILLKSGNGDEFVHVQGQYQLFNEDSTHKYCIDNGVMRECTEEELEEERASFPKPQPTLEDRMANLEAENETLKATNEELTVANEELATTMDVLLTELIPSLMGSE